MAIEQGNNLNSGKKPLTEGFPVPHQDNLKTEEPNKDRVGAGIILEAEMEKRDKLRVEKKNEEETKKQEELVAELIKNYNKGDYLEILALNNESKKNEEKEGLERKFDVQKTIEEINEKIAEKKKEKGVAFTPEEEKSLILEMFLKAKEDFSKENLESSGRLKNAFAKTEKWWEGLDKTRSGKMTKVVLGTVFISSATLLAGAGFGIAPPPLGITKRLLTRVGMATGLNMALTSNLSEKFLSAFKK